MSKEAVTLEEAPNLSQRAQDAWQLAESEVRKNPWRTVALAAGAGFVVGGGLFSPLTARLLGLGLRVGLRAGAIPLVAAQVSDWMEGGLTRFNDIEDEASSGGGARGRSRRRASS